MCIYNNEIIYIYICVCVCALELNECDPNPCLNSGTCIDGVQNYTCNCASFTEDGVRLYYTGRNCTTGEKEKMLVNSLAKTITIAISVF